ncbi:MAG: flagellar hook-associated protein FlgK [Gammaproteobacteria bacterium]
MSGDLLGIATGGLQAFQQALSTTGNNIANVNTDGYSREQVNLAPQIPVATGAGFIGTGVEVTGVTRSYNQFVTEQVRSTTSTNASLQTYANLAGNVANLLGDSSAGLSPALQSFFNAVQGVANNPTDPSARQVMLSQGQTLASRFNYMNQQLSDQRKQADGQLGDTVSQINSLAQSLAAINQKIVTATGQAGGQPPNTLLDQRDTLLNKLSQQVSVSTVAQSDGSLNVFIGKGQPLVTEFTAGSLSHTPAPAPGMQPVVSFSSSGNAGGVPVTDNLSGGKLGGLLSFRKQVLEPAQSALDRLAASVGTTFNSQHAKGMTLNGTLGGDFFNVSPTVSPVPTNAGGATVSATFDPSTVSQLGASSYTLTYNGSNNWTLTPAGGAATTLTGSGPFTAGGLKIAVSGTPSANDQYTIATNAARSIGVAIQDPANIAAAAPVAASNTSSNSGSGTLSNLTVQDPSNAGLQHAVSITFTSPTQYNVTDTTSGTALATGVGYTSGQSVTYNGWTATLQGSPAAGDSFTVGANTGGVGDNRNALALAGLQNSLTMDGGASSFSGNYSQLVANVGTKTSQAQTNQKAQQALLQQAQSAQSSVSGVNLDQEAANLVKYQQAYQAAAHVVTIANTVFQTLLSAVR